jgi:predicted Rossmann-fold nucleotide-binding protein
VREEGLLAIAKYGIVFAPGSAGTIQEVFQDAAQNHYESFGIASPMIFLGNDYWKWRKPVYPLLVQLAAAGGYCTRVQITDSQDEILKHISESAASFPA